MTGPHENGKIENGEAGGGITHAYTHVRTYVYLQAPVCQTETFPTENTIPTRFVVDACAVPSVHSESQPAGCDLDFV